MSADISGSTDFQIKFLEMVEREKLTPEQVYNMDETGINFKMLPETTFLSSHEKSAPGFKKNKERITVAVIGHLKNINLPIKAVLILDNAPTHPQDLTCHTADIKIIYLPPNVTSLIQPMDQGVIESLKKPYRRKLVSEILQYSESEDKGLLEIIKKINIKDVIYMLAMAFQEMPSATFVKSWRKLWPDIEKLVANANPSGGEEVENESILQDLQKLSGNDTMQPEDVENWIKNCDENLENEFLNDDEIIILATKEPQENDTETDDYEEEEKVSHDDARNVMEVALKYIEQQRESTALDLLELNLEWF
ncbi:jerky protein homolog-like [Anoplophora glabripennis]|uniref:jerky protein homolog-like n=1 Tax=Anoplophora glabripennis TaxID=217634 RepID=UPI000C75612F|nr:jerky protein homolog-like [Anoplophora glabripennis]